MDSGGALFDEAELLGCSLAHVDDSLGGVRVVLARKRARGIHPEDNRPSVLKICHLHVSGERQIVMGFRQRHGIELFSVSSPGASRQSPCFFPIPGGQACFFIGLDAGHRHGDIADSFDVIGSSFHTPQLNRFSDGEAIGALDVFPGQVGVQRSMDDLKGELPDAICELRCLFRELRCSSYNPYGSVDRMLGEAIAGLDR